jgi:hypothetical protein
MTQNTLEFALNVTILAITVLYLFYSLFRDLINYFRSEDGLERLLDMFRLLPPAGQLKIASILIQYQSMKRKRRRSHERHPQAQEDREMTIGLRRRM